MKRLEPGVYFNDNLIDLKIKHLLAQLNEIAPEKRKRIHAFSCLFYAKLTEVSKPEEAHTLVAKWTKNVDLFAMDYILFPINSANHWSLMVLARPDLLVRRKLFYLVYCLFNIICELINIVEYLILD